ncbi:MAG TPA: hypothetical protein VME46_21730 [Acidimicrobiales bacterium]|nr:hypothetical protein [Acidimicrobiales bacterium]
MPTTTRPARRKAQAAFFRLANVPMRALLALPPHSRRLQWTGLAVGGLAALGLLGAACSSTPKSPGVAGLASKPSTTAVPAAGQPTINGSSPMTKLLAYTHCMRAHGIEDFPDPTPGPNGHGGGFRINAGPGSDLGPNNPRYEVANKACQALLPFGGAPPTPTARQLAEEVKFAACIRRHGFAAFPNPNSQGTFVVHNFPLNAPQFQSAQNTCQSGMKLSVPIGIQDTDSAPNPPASH